MVDATARPPRSNGRQRPNGKERKAPRTKAKSHSAASERKRKEKGKARAQEEEEEEPTPRVAREGVEAWPYVQLASAQLDAPPVLYSKDGSVCFVPDFAAVKVYRPSTAQLLSTLQPDDPLAAGSVTALMLNPANALQLYVASKDGLIRTWDFIEGRQIRSIDLGFPPEQMCCHASNPEVLYVGTSRKLAHAAERPGASKISHAVYIVKLKQGGTVLDGQPRKVGRVRRLKTIQLTFDGAYLVAACIGGGIFIIPTAHLSAGFAFLDLEKPFTALDCHPSELSIATGDQRGRVQIWYPFDPAWWKAHIAAKEANRSNYDATISCPTRLFHWHAHAVASLAYTPNGAYLCSGGEEAVLVFWQLATGHKEFLPRLGAPIVNLTVSGSGDEAAIMLADATVLLIEAQQLVAKRSIASIKLDASLDKPKDVDIPLASQPGTSNLVLLSSHPSSIQFYSPSTGTHILELEVSPSNRATRNVDKAVEPARVEHVAFSPSRTGQTWLATVDAWRTADFAEEVYLKLWLQRGPTAQEGGYGLDTRIDRPHGPERLTGIAFAGGNEATLATCGQDGQVRLWHRPAAAEQTSWRCRSAFGYRDLQPVSLAWSVDGSLLAVAFPRVIVLFSNPSCNVVATFANTAVSPFTHVAFAGKEGSTLVAGGESGVVAWDVVKGEEVFHLGCLLSHLLARPGADTVIALETLPPTPYRPNPTTTAFIIDLSTRDARAREIPATIKAATLVDSPFGEADSLAVAVITDDGSIGLAGDGVQRPAALPALPIEATELAARSLFDDLFGTSALRALPYEARKPPVRGQERREAGLPEVLQAPSHVIPPLSTIWRNLLPLPPRRDGDEVVKEDDEAMDVDEPVVLAEGEAKEVELPIYEAAVDLDKLFATALKV